MKKMGVWAMLVISGCILTGCGKHVEADITAKAIETEAERTIVIGEPDTETEPSTEAAREQQRVERDGKIPSYLTGEMTDISTANRRPVAVMISNDKQAQPHYGINHAGVIYEAPVEGTMNRFMAIFEDYDNLDRIGSVRSSRTYYTFFAREFEAIYAHYGQSVFALPYLKNMDHLDGIEGKGAVAFYRTKDRKAPHNAYASAESIKKAIASLGYSEEYPAGYGGHYLFARPDNPETLEAGIPVVRLKPGYVYNDPWFEYNEEDGLYYRFQYGGPHNGNEGQLAVKNIIFQYCPVGFYRSTEYLDINVHTPGFGYYFTGGRGTAVNWKKDDTYGVTRYYDSDGKEILLNPGKTWVCIISSDRVDKAEFYGEQTD